MKGLILMGSLMQSSRDFSECQRLGNGIYVCSSGKCIIVVEFRGRRKIYMDFPRNKSSDWIIVV